LRAIQALQVSTGFTPLLIRRALDAAFEELAEAKLRRFWRDRIAGESGLRTLTVLHIAAGNVFTAWLHGAVVTLLMGHRCRIKPSSTEPVFARLWKDSVSQTDSSAARRIEIVSWNENLKDEADLVVAYGSDPTISLLRNKFHPKPVIGYGHKLSAGIIFEKAGRSDGWPDWKERLVRDAEAFERRGCLSPQILYVEDGMEDVVRGALVGPAVRMISFKEEKDLYAGLDSLGPYLSCIGVAGGNERIQKVRNHYRRKPQVRICRLGDMQRPSLFWNNGGIDLVREIGRIADV